MTVRAAREADAGAVTSIHERAWAVSFAGIADPGWIVDRPVAERLAEWRRWCRGEGAPIWVAEDEAGRVVGFVGAGPSSDAAAAEGDTTGEVIVLFVDPDAQRRGHGAALLARAVAALREAGFERATVWTLTDSPRSRAFYLAQGWREDGAERQHPLGFHETRYARSVT